MHGMRKRTIALIGFVCGLAAFGETTTNHAVAGKYFEMPKPAGATYPFRKVPNRIYFDTIRDTAKIARPIKRCILVHGFGVTQGFLGFFFHRLGKGAGITRRMIQRRGKSPAEAFGDFYWGGSHLVDSLAESVCDDVIVTAQDTSQRSLQEIVETLEAFLEKETCTADTKPSRLGQKACALIGHSLGGAAVTAIAQRCKEGNGTLSAEACGNISEVYSAAGAIGGVTLAAGVAGASEKKDYAYVQGVLDELGIESEVADIYHAGAQVDYEYGFKAYLDLLSDVHPGITQPTWYSLSPVAQIGGEPLWNQRLKDLKAGGGFKGDYAASATQFDFDKERGFPGCGTPVDGDQMPLVRKRMAEVCDGFSTVTEQLHNRKAKAFFALGVARLEKVFEQKFGGVPPSFTRDYTWEHHQNSDGKVEMTAALSVCLNTHGAVPADSLTADCRVFKNGGTGALNHLAIGGYAKELVEHLVEKLKD